jgi:hypothetical protein
VICACGDKLDDHDGEKGPCRVCFNDPDRARCMSFRPTATSTARRDGIKPVSEHRAEVNRERSRAQLAAWGPRPWPCAMAKLVGGPLLVERRDGSTEKVTVPRCGGQVHGHEIVSRARDRTDKNLVDVTGQEPLCNRHNGFLTSFAAVPGWAEHSWSAK